MARHLTAAIGLVALASLSLFAFLTIRVVDQDVSSLSQQDEKSLGQSVAAALGASYAATGSWSTAQLGGLNTFLSKRAIQVTVLDATGRQVFSANPAQDVHDLGHPYFIPVHVGQTQIGTVSVRARQSGIGIAQGVRRALSIAVWWSTAFMGALTIGVGYFIARRFALQLNRLTEGARQLAAGKRGTRIPVTSGSKEFAQLTAAFNTMALNIERQEDLRRQLVADVAHELRTPVAVLQAWLEAMVDDVVDTKKATLSSLLDETLRLSRIVQDLQVLSAADVEVLSLEMHPVDLAEVAADAVLAIGTRLASAQLSLTQQLEPAVVHGDPVRLHQVVSNLLMNAIKFTPSGGRIALTVSSRGPNAVVVVEDSGVGIPADELHYVFKRFWRGQGAQRRGGSGIGLAVVEELAKAHGGEVSVRSRQGEGSRFTVTVPLATVPAPTG